MTAILVPKNQNNKSQNDAGGVTEWGIKSMSGAIALKNKITKGS